MIAGKKLTVKEAAGLLGNKPAMIYHKMRRHGITAQEAFERSLNDRGRGN